MLLTHSVLNYRPTIGTQNKNGATAKLTDLNKINTR